MDDKVLKWLLEEENPSVRYYTLVDLLGRSVDDGEVKLAKEEIMNRGVVSEILAQQSEGGFWSIPEKFYTDKYNGTSWNLLLLAELGANGQDSRIQKACEFILDSSQDRMDGGFSYSKSAKLGGGLPSGVVPCLTGNMVYSFIKLGYLDDPRIQKGIGWITKYQRSDDGEYAGPSGVQYERYEMCWGKHSCHMGVAKALKALAAIPEKHRSVEVQKKIFELSEYFLNHHIYKKSHNTMEISRPGWLKPGFPLMYQTDIFELLEIMTRLGIRDHRLDDALEIVMRKQQGDGKWKMENSFNCKMSVLIEKKGDKSKWITLRALRILSGL